MGKKTTALDMSRYLLCEGNKEDSCLCRSCKSKDHPDLTVIGTYERIKVADVDRILEFCGTTPFLSDRKVVILDNADGMTYESANRLLKMLEEPPPYMVFFLVSSDPKSILHTVRSRCLWISFGSLQQQDLINIFWKKMGFDLPQARVLGWIGSESSMDVFSNAGAYLKYRQLAFDFVSGVRTMGLLDALDFVDKVAWKELPLFMDMVIMILTDIMMLQGGLDKIVNADMREDLESLKTLFHDRALISATHHLTQAKITKNYYINMNLSVKCSMMKAWPLLSTRGS